MDRYGLASGKNFNTIADTELKGAHYTALMAITQAESRQSRELDRWLVISVRRLVRAARDVERQRAFERGMEAFAAMPMVRERHIADSTPSRWTPGVYEGD